MTGKSYRGNVGVGIPNLRRRLSSSEGPQWPTSITTYGIIEPNTKQREKSHPSRDPTQEEWGPGGHHSTFAELLALGPAPLGLRGAFSGSREIVSRGKTRSRNEIMGRKPSYASARQKISYCPPGTVRSKMGDANKGVGQH